ncbi:MAG TPA: HD-GYP domain-containing protein [Actinomycetes bacterium]
MAGLPRAARAYISVLAILAVGVIAFNVPSGLDGQQVLTILILAVLFLTLESLSSFVFVGVSMSLSFTITLASILIAGPWGAAVIGLSVLVVPGRHPWSKRVFNAAQFSLAAYVAGRVYELLGGSLVRPGMTNAADLLAPTIAADLTCLFVNALLVTGIMVMVNRVPAREVLTGILGSHFPSYIAYGGFGLVLAVLWVGLDIGPLAALLLLMPLLVARWAMSQYSQERQAYEATIRTLVQAVETKDAYTRGHSERVARASVMIARVIGMREDRMNALRYAGILHDLGKLGVPTKVLQKSGKLTEEEFAAIKLHPLRGMEMLGDIEFLDEAFQGILHHHERLDGLGYPMGLKGAQIPEFARVIAVADAFDSMTSTRSYRTARTVEAAVEEIRRCRGSQFDAVMVDALVKALAKDPWQAAAEVPSPSGDETETIDFDHDDPSFPASASPVEG